MNPWDLVYFSYKYYYRSSILPPSSAYDNHFEEPYLPETYPDGAISVSIGGDLMPYEMIRPDSTVDLWKEVGEDFFGSDLVFANLETPLDKSHTSRFVPEMMLNHMFFNTDERTFNVFNGNGSYKGFDVLSIANNHSLDMSVEGLDATMDYLKGRQIDYVGAKKALNDNDFVIREVGGIKIGFVAYTYSLNTMLPPEGMEWKVNYMPLNKPDCALDRLVDQVKSCRDAGAEYIICSLHCGNAYQAYPSACTIELFKRVFETSGVDLIAGGHPHNLQPWRSYNYFDPFTGKNKKGFAIYSLADFVAYDIYAWCHLSAYLKVRLWRDKEEVKSSIEVKPMVMERVNDQLKLRYAESLMSHRHERKEWKDIGILYDICIKA